MQVFRHGLSDKDQDPDQTRKFAMLYCTETDVFQRSEPWLTR